MTAGHCSPTKEYLHILNGCRKIDWVGNYPTPNTLTPPGIQPPHLCTNAMYRPMHGPASPSTKTQIRPHLTYRYQSYMILLLSFLGWLIIIFRFKTLQDMSGKFVHIFNALITTVDCASLVLGSVDHYLCMGAQWWQFSLYKPLTFKNTVTWK